MELLDTGVRCHLLEFMAGRELGSVCVSSTDWRSRTEFSARLRVAEFVRKVGLEGLMRIDRASLGFEGGTPWRCVLWTYLRCALWLRADAAVEVDEGDRVVLWRDALGGSGMARRAATTEAPRLVRRDDGASVDFRCALTGRGLVISGDAVPEVSVGVMLAVSAVSGDSTLVDSGEAGAERFELCHGYPTDGIRDQPRICFTASNSGDPPMRALWGETRSTGERHVYSIVFGHKSWKRNHPPDSDDDDEAPPPPPTGGPAAAARRILRAASLGRVDEAPHPPPPDGLTIFGPRRRRYNTRQRSRDDLNAATANRKATLFVDSRIEGCDDVGPNGASRGLTIGSDRNGSYRLRGEISAFALWTGSIPASCLYAFERALIAKYNIKPTTIHNRPRAASA